MKNFQGFMFFQKRVFYAAGRNYGSLHLSKSAVDKARPLCHSDSKNESYSRYNVFNIQMLPDHLHKQLFKECYLPGFEHNINSELLKASTDHLNTFELLHHKHNPLPDVKFQLPPLQGDNIDMHFQNVAKEQAGQYFSGLYDLITTDLPQMPSGKYWSNVPGWTKYIYDDDNCLKCFPVQYPEERAIVFDCEVLVSKSEMPVMAVAVSKNAWYSWTSTVFTDDCQVINELKSLVPMEAPCSNHEFRDKEPKLVVGHNIAYDRARIREQYYPHLTDVRFLDTMSMHIAVSGFNGQQRTLWKSAMNTEKSEEEKAALKTSWFDAGSMNGLSDVHRFYCGSAVTKELRDVFVKGSLADVQQDFHVLMDYCAQDVVATHRILKQLTPLFFTRFPHPVTFAGMLEMGQMYLPINSNWNRFIKTCQDEYDSLNQELRSHLIGRASDACHLEKDQRYKNDIWLWDMDWTVPKYKLLQKPRKGWKTLHVASEVKQIEQHLVMPHMFTTEEKAALGKCKVDPSSIDALFTSSVENVWMTASRLPKVIPHLPGYPKWYSQLCRRESEDDWTHGAVLQSPLTRTTPKLLRMTWDGCPLHYAEKLGWGYLLPNGKTALEYPEDCKEDDAFFEFNTEEAVENNLHTPATSVEGIPAGYVFHRLPHKDGIEKNVGSPMSKDFLTHIESGTLSSADAANAVRCLEINKMCSYWRSSKERILSQIVVPLAKNVVPLNVAKHGDNAIEDLAAIVPQVITCGTVSRRAVERTWLTASNVLTDRIGSELKSMVQAPPGMCFVGADVDSQELWIASLLGDSASAGEHGCTALSWMTLQGNKHDGTDLHSKTAAAIGASRDQAKVFNYSRMYGAGKKAALRTLMQNNQHLSRKECVEKVNTLYDMTKGDAVYQLSEEALWIVKKTGVKISFDALLTGLCKYEDVCKIKHAAEKSFGSIRTIRMQNLVSGKKWSGGIESHMFNKLEEIAFKPKPTTPVLDCCLSQALVPARVRGAFATSRMNWVVQSSAVDYLHLMLVAMRWLLKKYRLNARLALSIHDELRYLADENQCYDVALALQVANLWTRCMFVYKLGMHDLPLSVAFFSSVEIDSVIRKDAADNCVTPSNPNGLREKYNIPLGKSLTIHDILEKTNGECFS